ncbi:MAG: flavodoxin family protein [Deltaproteobacteria bacterium]
MKVIVINAAPRMEAGNTQMILNPLLVGLRHEGAHVDVALLARKTIEPCIGCFTCYAQTPGECIHLDDMLGLNERIRAADMMVLATPIYIDGMTSLAKTFVDRLVTFLDPHISRMTTGSAIPFVGSFRSSSSCFPCAVFPACTMVSPASCGLLGPYDPKISGTGAACAGRGEKGRARTGARWCRIREDLSGSSHGHLYTRGADRNGQCVLGPGVG